MSKRLYITGLNSTGEDGLALYLRTRYLFDVIPLNKEFNKLSFQERIKVIQTALVDKEKVIATSFGAYLFLNSITKTNKDLKVLLLSPILGTTSVNGGSRIPRNYTTFKRRIKSNELPIPSRMKILSGDSDIICSIENIDFIKSYYPSLNISILTGQGLELLH